MTVGAEAEASKVAANKELARRLAEEFFNERRLEVADEVFAPDLKLHTHVRPGPQGLAEGVEGIREMVAWIWYGWPDARVTIEQLVGEGDLFATRFTFRATHSGILHGNPPTGRSAAWDEMFFARVRDGKIEEFWHEVDIHGVLEQIGVLRPLRVMGPMPRPLRAAMKLRGRVRRRLRPRYRLDKWRVELVRREAEAGSARR